MVVEEKEEEGEGRGAASAAPSLEVVSTMSPISISTLAAPCRPALRALRPVQVALPFEMRDQ